MAALDAVASLDVFGGAGTPSWFKPESFLAQDFNPEAYVAELKKFVPLEAVSSELESHLATLKTKLVEVINEDYNDFVSLTTKLVNIDGSVLRMQKPLLELKDRLQAVHSAIKDQLNALNEGLARRQAVAAARATLELMQDTAHVMSKVEKLVAEAGEVGDPSSLSNDELDAHSRLLERVAGEVARLKFYATRGHDLPFIHQLSARISAATGTLEGHLNTTLHTALLSHHNSAVFHCLHAYAAVSLTAAGEEVIRRAMIHPLVSESMAKHQPDGPRSNIDANTLKQLYCSIASGLPAQCGKLLEVTLSPQSGLQSFNLLGNSILAEVDEQLSERMPGVFSPGLPASFLANYTASMEFINQLEALCVTQGSVNSLRSCQAYTTFNKRWNLPVYFSLVFQDIAGAVESSVNSNSLSRVPKGDASGFNLQPTHSCWESLEKCVSPQLFLRVMADKFLRLTLQILARYASWVSSVLEVRSRGDAFATNTAVGGDQDEARSHWAVKATPETLVLLLSDTDRLVTVVQGHLMEAITGHLQGMPQEVLSGVQQSVGECVDQVEGVAGGVRDAVVGVCVERCVLVIKQLRGIVATFRMTNKTLPTRPSHYCGAILTSLKQFMDSEEAQTLSEQQRLKLVTCVVNGVTERYQQLVDDTLTTVRKTESSLKRLKGRRAADNAELGAEGATETDKMICMQLFLDVQEYGRSVLRYGVQPAQLQSFQQLWQTVAPEDKKAVVTITA